MDSTIKMLGYTKELGAMLKHVKNHMPATHQHTSYPGSDDEISDDTTVRVENYYTGYFSLRVVNQQSDEYDSEGNTTTVTKSYFVVCDGGSWDDTTQTSSPSKCKWHGHLIDVPCIFSEQDIDSLGAEWFAGTSDNTIRVTREVRLFVHHLYRTGWIKFVPDDITEYNNSVISCASSFSTMLIGQVAISRNVISSTTETEEGDAVVTQEYTYSGSVIANMNFPILFLQQLAATGGITNFNLTVSNDYPELTNAYGYGGNYSIIMDIADQPSNAKFNSTLFTHNLRVRIVKPNYILTGDALKEPLDFYVNNKAFSLPPAYLTLPTTSPPAEGGDVTSIPVVALKYTRATLSDTSTTPQTDGLSATLEFAVYDSVAAMQADVSYDNAIMALGTYSIVTNTIAVDEGVPSVTTITSISDTDTTGQTNILLYYQCVSG